MGAIIGATILVWALSQIPRAVFAFYGRPHNQRNAIICGLVGTAVAFGLGCVASVTWASESPGFTPVAYVIGGIVYLPIAILLAGRGEKVEKAEKVEP